MKALASSGLARKTRPSSSSHAHASSQIARGVIYAGALFTTLVLLGIVGFILVNGVPHLTPTLFEWSYTSENVSLMPGAHKHALYGVARASDRSAHRGLFGDLSGGIRETRKSVRARGTRYYRNAARHPLHHLRIVRHVVLHHGAWLGAFFALGACTLAIMVLPVVMRTAEEALIAVPASYRAGGFALGAGYLRTIFRCVLPSALPGIVGGVLLALGRCVGEVAALLFTAGTIAQIPDFGGQGIFALFDSCRTLAVHMYVLASEGLHIDETYATAVVLLVLVTLLNVIANVAEKRLRVK